MSSPSCSQTSGMRVLRSVLRSASSRPCEPFVIAEHEVTVSASVGIALGKGDTVWPSDLLRNADTALYQAKRTKGRYEVFRPSMHTRTLKRLKLEGDLRRSIDRGRLRGPLSAPGDARYPHDSRNGGSGVVGTPETRPHRPHRGAGVGGSLPPSNRVGRTKRPLYHDNDVREPVDE